jgi:hypothetical protein
MTQYYLVAGDKIRKESIMTWKFTETDIPKKCVVHKQRITGRVIDWHEWHHNGMSGESGKKIDHYKCEGCGIEVSKPFDYVALAASNFYDDDIPPQYDGEGDPRPDCWYA